MPYYISSHLFGKMCTHAKFHQIILIRSQDKVLHRTGNVATQGLAWYLATKQRLRWYPVPVFPVPPASGSGTAEPVPSGRYRFGTQKSRF